MRRPTPLVVANWKLNPPRLAEARSLYTELTRALPKDRTADVVIAPPALYLPELARRKLPEGVSLGAQDCFFADAGAYTGQLAPRMFADFGATHVIIGHSERRALGESDAVVARKLRAALKHKLTPILCIGESERDEQGEFFGFVEAQLKAAVGELAPAQLKKTIIAYEPIWAIGTGNHATPEDVREMQLYIVSVLTKLFDRQTASAVTLLYGGSVKSSNAAALHQEGGMRGFLVGGASRRPDDFAGIVSIVSS